MAVVTESQLKTDVEAAYVALLEKKCNYLCLGKCVTDLNAEIKKVYAYWSIIGIWDCSMTEDEINCVQSVINACTFVKAKFDPDLSASSIPPVWSPLGGSILATSGTCDPITLKASAFGGVAPYTYAWSCLDYPVGGGGCDGVVIVSPTSDTTVITGGHKIVAEDGTFGITYTRINLIITDSEGNTVVVKYLFSGCP